MHVETCQGPVTTGYNRLAATRRGARLIRKWPLLFELPSYSVVERGGGKLNFILEQATKAQRGSRSIAAFFL
jgi:hypothetical protein